MSEDLGGFSSSVLDSLLSVSNVVFCMRAGYFAPASELTPLLHIWCPAAYEEFVILFLLLFVIFLERGRLVVVTVVEGLFAASLFIVQMRGNFEPSHSPAHTGRSWQSQTPFKGLLPCRVWELLIGVGIAIWQFQSTEPASKQYRLKSGILGLSSSYLLGYAIFTFDRTTSFSASMRSYRPSARDL